MSEDNFESGIFWELYLDLERQFQDFIQYVPYLKGNENVYSFKLLNLILSIGGHVDSAFKEMARHQKFAQNVECQEILKRASTFKSIIEPCLRAFEKEYRLSTRVVTFKRLPAQEKITPFTPFNPKTNAPEWWVFYNGLKHDVGIRLEQANLLNTLHALGGAFLLNVIHIPAALRLFQYGILKVAFEGDRYYQFGKIACETGFNREQVEGILEKKQRNNFFIETNLFKYKYDQ